MVLLKADEQQHWSGGWNHYLFSIPLTNKLLGRGEAAGIVLPIVLCLIELLSCDGISRYFVTRFCLQEFPSSPYVFSIENTSEMLF